MTVTPVGSAPRQYFQTDRHVDGVFFVVADKPKPVTKKPIGLDVHQAANEARAKVHSEALSVIRRCLDIVGKK